MYVCVCVGEASLHPSAFQTPSLVHLAPPQISSALSHPNIMSTYTYDIRAITDTAGGSHPNSADAAASEDSAGARGAASEAAHAAARGSCCSFRGSACSCLRQFDTESTPAHRASPRPPHNSKPQTRWCPRSRRCSRSCGSGGCRRPTCTATRCGRPPAAAEVAPARLPALWEAACCLALMLCCSSTLM